jgi:hypothetical protein
MQTPKTIPEFLCYRYKGVRRTDQILANAVQFAWKCRKYQNWKEVQNAPDDKQVLLKFADSILDDGKLRASDYGRISGIFYNVQRWRKDKQELAEEPDSLPSWTELDTLLHVVDANPKVVVHKLEKEVLDFKQIPLSSIWDFFYCWALLQMLQAQKVPDLPSMDTTYTAHSEKLAQQITTLVHRLYSAAGLNCPTPPCNSGVRGLISAACADLGLPAPRFHHEFSLADFTDRPAAKTIVVQHASLDPLQLIKIGEVEGHIRLTINADHAFVQAALTDEKARTVLEIFLTAYAEAAQQLPAQKETLDALISYMGIILKRRSNHKR